MANNPARNRGRSAAQWPHNYWPDSTDQAAVLLSFFEHDRCPFEFEAEELSEVSADSTLEQLPAMISDRLEQAAHFRTMGEQLEILRAQLDIALEAYRLVVVSRETPENLSQTWLGYLFSLLVAGPLARDQAERAITLWATLQRVGDLRPPHAAPLKDGTFSMAWDKAQDHFEIELQPSGLFDWFYLDRLTDRMEGEQDLPIGYSSALMMELLRRVAIQG